MYEDATCQVIHDGKLTEPFSVKTGFYQGCLFSPIIFLMMVDWVMRQSTADQKTGIQWTFNKPLEDLDFADDISVLSHKQQNAQQKLCRVAEKAEKTGFQINTGKSKIMKVNNKNQDPVKLHHDKIKKVDKFVYLGSVSAKMGEQTKTSRAASTKLDTFLTPFDKSGDQKPSQSAIRSRFSTLM